MDFLQLKIPPRYIVCIFAAHNFGMAAISRSLRFKTRSWWFEEVDEAGEEAEQKLLEKARRNFLAPPHVGKWTLLSAARR
jgi:hypothetical protein